MNDELNKTENTLADDSNDNAQIEDNTVAESFPQEDASVIKETNVNNAGTSEAEQDNEDLSEEEKTKRAEAEAKEKAKREEIQKYIDSLADKDVYDPNSYEVHLENFDGPLDLLWFLIRRSKIDISEIFVSEITEQYLASMAEIDSLDLERASEFLWKLSRKRCFRVRRSSKILRTIPRKRLSADWKSIGYIKKQVRKSKKSKLPVCIIAIPIRPWVSRGWFSAI